MAVAMVAAMAAAVAAGYSVQSLAGPVIGLATLLVTGLVAQQQAFSTK